MSASIATPRPCRSPGGIATITTPFFRPRRANLAPSRPISDAATLLARCSCSIPTAPDCHRLADGMERRGQDLDVDVPRLASGGHRRLDDPPAAGEVAAQHPTLQAVAPGRRVIGLAGAPPTARRRGGQSRRRLQIGRVDPPRPADLPSRQHAHSDPPVRGHVVDAEAFSRLVQGYEPGVRLGHDAPATGASCHERRTAHQPARVPANTCHASADFATRLNVM